MRARDVKAATKAMDEYLGVVHQGMDAEPVALLRPGRTPVAPVSNMPVQVKAANVVKKAAASKVKTPVRLALR